MIRYHNVELAYRHADILRAMPRDPEWAMCSEDVAWWTWLLAVRGKEEAKLWLRKDAVVKGLHKLVVRRSNLKRCLAPGLLNGCYRQALGQLCLPAGPSHDCISFVREDMRQEEQVAAALRGGHGRSHHPHLANCADLVLPTRRKVHYVRERAMYAEEVLPIRLGPDTKDAALIQPTDEEPHSMQVPVIDTVLGPPGAAEHIGPLLTIFLTTTTDPRFLDESANALGIIPHWASMADVAPTDPEAALLDPAIARILDRAEMFRSCHEGQRGGTEMARRRPQGQAAPESRATSRDTASPLASRMDATVGCFATSAAHNARSRLNWPTSCART